jgi:hypothetical protein
MTDIISNLVKMGSALDDEVAALIRRYGAEAVREVVAKSTKKRRGRRPEKDGPLIALLTREDAIDWLENRDPFKLRSNYSIAKQFAEQNSGQSTVSTKERIERKLKLSRKRLMLKRAFEIARKEYPFTDYLRALESLCLLDLSCDTWSIIMGWKREKVEEYRKLFGEPEPIMTFDAIEMAIKENHEKRGSISSLALRRRGIIGGGKGGILSIPPR